MSISAAALGIALLAVAVAAGVLEPARSLDTFRWRPLWGARFDRLLTTHEKLAAKGGRRYCRRCTLSMLPLLAQDVGQIASDAPSSWSMRLLTWSFFGLWALVRVKAYLLPGKDDLRPLLALEAAMARLTLNS